MHITNYTEFRNNLAQNMEIVTNDFSPVIITRGQKKPVVLISLENYGGLTETNYLMKNKNNRKRLLHSINDKKEILVDFDSSGNLKKI
ncbi:MAG: type II toxin-antitoxin system Phd/YefM family antitoxin [Alphaproteobacteria bacterium]|nr:MAG: hypothetical protein B6I23_02545 [Rickettsiaceae bacterium 4572_127]